VCVCVFCVIHGLMPQMHLVYSSELGVYVYAAAQVKKAMEVGISVSVYNIIL
jgi:xylose isomerase